MATVQEILQAATTICQIREEDKIHLLSHRNELEFAFQTLQKVLERDPESIAPSTHAIPALTDSFSAQTTEQCPSISDIPLSDVPGSTITISASQDKAVEFGAVDEQAEVQVAMTEELPTSVKEVLRLLDKKKKSIYAFQYEPKACSDFENEDIRVTIIKSVTLKRTPSDYYRAGLSALSLADDFTNWQGQAGGPKRLDVLCNDVNDKTGAVYRAYVDTCTFIDDKEMAAEFIEFGIKLRYFETICWVRYNGPVFDTFSTADIRTGLDATSPERFAIIYPLFFVWRSFYRCRYADLSALANALLSSQYWRHLAGTKDWQPNDWQGLMARQKRKRSFTSRPFDDRSKRQRRQLIPSQTSKTPTLLPSHCISAPNVQNIDPRLYPQEAQHITSGSVWPLGYNIFPDQPQDLETRDVFPVGPTIFPDMLQTTPTPEPLTPTGLHLSTPELNRELDNMLMNLNANMNNQPISPT